MKAFTLLFLLPALASCAPYVPPVAYDDVCIRHPGACGVSVPFVAPRPISKQIGSGSSAVESTHYNQWTLAQNFSQGVDL